MKGIEMRTAWSRLDLARSSGVGLGLAALVVVCVSLPGCERRPSDAELKQAASAALGSSEQLKDIQLKVDVKDGELTIEGRVPSEAVRLAARKAAEAVPGVRKVDDMMEVPPPRIFTFPAGTNVRVEMVDGIDSAANGAGQAFHAKLASSLVSGETVVVPEGADVVVRLAQVSQAGKMKGRSELAVQLASLTCLGTDYDINSTTVAKAGGSRGEQSARRIAIAGGVGAAVGAIIGGGKGAAIGAGVGGGSATVYQLTTRGKAVRIPSGARLDFALERPLSITLPPKL